MKGSGEPGVGDGVGAFVRVAQASSVLGVGAMAGFIYSVKEVNPELRLAWTMGSFVACVVGGLVAYWFWRGVASGLTAGGVRLALVFGGLMTLGTVVGCAYALKDLRSERVREVVAGVVLAVVALAFLGGVVVCIGRYLEEDHRRNAVGEGEDKGDQG